MAGRLPTLLPHQNHKCHLAVLRLALFGAIVGQRLGIAITERPAAT